eukprot:1377598-Amphidinium_carterae.1
MLGWRLAQKEPPSEVFVSLGVDFDLRRAHASQRFWVTNPPTRCEALSGEWTELSSQRQVGVFLYAVVWTCWQGFTESFGY